MHKDWPKMADDLNVAIKEVRLGTPEVMKAFSAMASAATPGRPWGWRSRRRRLPASGIGGGWAVE